MLIGILQTGVSPEQLSGEMGDYPDMFERLLEGHGFTFQTFRVLDGVFPPDVQACDGWLITGSKFGAYEDHAWIPPLEDFIRASFAAHVPMVGICFGHQIIAQAMGGRVEKFTKGWAVGPTEYDFGGKTVRLNAWHQDQVIEKPAAAQVAGRNAFCANAALVYDDRVFTVQAHPEFRPAFVDGLMKTRGKGLVPDALLKAATAKLDTPLDSDSMAGQIAAFFKQPRG
ncbi:type 1 glutamine amidotransferase [Pseudorhodobacter ferrugineus]|uniref:type 1 glutamine amidotransferase n=1 Tax=Pseudorhodobacter ferrugineus TaxID=77008 RepID=UPI0003B50922|nr:type 1 glutamine amidotransferase [Pseudorhodobacter ferrugineus]